MRIARSVGCWLFVVMLATLLEAPLGQAQSGPSYCDSEYVTAQINATPPQGHDKQNVVLIVLDDVSAGEFPGLNVPFKWADQDNPEADPAAFAEAGLRRPDLNRLAGRVFARTTGCTGTVGTGEACLGPATSQSPGTLAVPADLDDGAGPGGATSADTTADDFRYSEISPDPTNHILRGFGGLAKLARSGVAYTRHYAPSGRCAPTRASIFTGRSHIDVGVTDNGAALKVQHITIADFMKKRGYRTGLIGKWHMRNGDNRSSWQRGFDETFHYEAPSRAHEKSKSLICAPLRSDHGEPRKYCTQAWALPSGRCTTDLSCNAVVDGSSYPCSGGKCVCAPGWDGNGATGIAGKCYLKKPDEDCTQGQPCTTGVCRAWGKYLGPEPLNVRSGCHPDDRDNPLCCTPKEVAGLHADEYSFGKMTDRQTTDQNGNPIGKLFWRQDAGDGTDASQPCYYNDSSTFDTTDRDADTDRGGCRYDTRYFRDAAKNFIARNQADPFFLYIAIHGLHAPNAAPRRVEAHYNKTAPGRPRAPAQQEAFWGALEEIDAAIGQILESVEQTPALAAKTLVLLTADQGRASSGFGEPMLKDGKGSVSEGGIRVGLHAWAPGTIEDGGLQITSASLTTEMTDALSSGVSSHADLFATIAHASGCIPKNDLGQYTVRTCQSAERNVCTTNGDCTQPGPQPPQPPSACQQNPDGANCVHCVARLIAGRSLLPKLSTRVAAYSDYAGGYKARDLSFAQYLGSGYAVVARRGADALGLPTGTKIGVCGVDATIEAGAAPENSPIDRKRRAGSKLRCTPELPVSSDPLALYNTEGDGWCVDQAEEPCTGNGKFCVHNDLKLACEGVDPSACLWREYPRCRGPKDCQADYKCMAVKVKCEGCFEAEFKLRGSGGNGTGTNPFNLVTPKDLFDLRTNPEEVDDLNLVNVPAFESVRENLRARLGGWWDCVRNHDEPNEIADCESCVEGDSSCQ